jgi:hypothetical protein
MVFAVSFNFSFPFKVLIFFLYLSSTRIDNKRESDIAHLHLLPLVPENKSKYKTDSQCHEKPHSVISWVLPVRPFLFQEACLALCKEALRVLCREVKVLRSWFWFA